RAIVAAIHELARALGLQTVAEGIETDAQQRVLTELGCALGPGFLFAPALTPDATRAFVELAHRDGLSAAREAQHQGPAQAPGETVWQATRL
ncbi:EAL domain-containing protein, partial [Acinetobacter baumannii]